MPAQSNKVEDKYAPTQWASSGVGGLRDLQMPSGQLALVKSSSIEALLVAGVIHDVDSLTQMVETTHINKATGKPQPDVKKIMKNPDMVKEMFHLIDKVVCHVVVKPEVHMTPNDPTRRKNGVVYCDMISQEDRLFIFNYAVGGTAEAVEFPEESKKDMGSVATRKKSTSKAK